MLGPTGTQEIDQAITMPHAIDLCGPCEKSLAKWWARGRREEDEAAQ